VARLTARSVMGLIIIGAVVVLLWIWARNRRCGFEAPIWDGSACRHLPDVVEEDYLTHVGDRLSLRDDPEFIAAYDAQESACRRYQQQPLSDATRDGFREHCHFRYSRIVDKHETITLISNDIAKARELLSEIVGLANEMDSPLGRRFHKRCLTSSAAERAPLMSSIWFSWTAIKSELLAAGISGGSRSVSEISPAKQKL